MSALPLPNVCIAPTQCLHCPYPMSALPLPNVCIAPTQCLHCPYPMSTLPFSLSYRLCFPIITLSLSLQHSNLPTDLVDVVLNVPGCQGLAVDYVDDLLFWTDGVTQTLEVARLDGTGRKLLVINMKKPRGIALHPKIGSVVHRSVCCVALRSVSDHVTSEGVLSHILSLQLPPFLPLHTHSTSVAVSLFMYINEYIIKFYITPPPPPPQKME